MASAGRAEGLYNQSQYKHRYMVGIIVLEQKDACKIVFHLLKSHSAKFLGNIFRHQFTSLIIVQRWELKKCGHGYW